MYYKVGLLVCYLGWADLILDIPLSRVLLRQMEIWQNWLVCWSTHISQPTHVTDHHPHPVVLV